MARAGPITDYALLVTSGPDQFAFFNGQFAISDFSADSGCRCNPYVQRPPGADNATRPRPPSLLPRWARRGAAGEVAIGLAAQAIADSGRDAGGDGSAAWFGEKGPPRRAGSGGSPNRPLHPAQDHLRRGEG